MKMEQILLEIKNLSRSKRFYGQLLENLTELQSNNPERYEDVKNELESQNFKDVVDMVLYFES